MFTLKTENNSINANNGKEIEQCTYIKKKKELLIMTTNTDIL